MQRNNHGPVVRAIAASFLPVLFICPAVAQNEIVMIEDFTNGVTFDALVLQDRTWTRTKSDNNSAAVAYDNNGNQVMKHDELNNYGQSLGGGPNGLYAIYPNIVPATGDYTLRCTAKFVEFPVGTGAGTYDAYQNYQIMVTVNGGHRSGTSALPTPTYKSDFIGGIHLTTADDTGNPPVTLKTSVFPAVENDSLCISFGTYHDFSRTYYSKTAWNGSYILIDNIELVPDPEPTTPVSLSGWELE